MIIHVASISVERISTDVPAIEACIKIVVKIVDKIKLCAKMKKIFRLQEAGHYGKSAV